MEASIKTAVVNLRKSITCSVCLEYFSFPVSISCGHTFCKICIHNVMKVKKACPICSTAFSKRSLVSESHIEHVIIRVARFLDEKSESAIPSNDQTPLSDAQPKTLGTPAGKRSKSIDSKDFKFNNTKILANSSSVLPKPPQLYAVGEMVNVMARSWAGVNKPGGTGRVMSCSEQIRNSGKDPVLYEYKIRYVLDGSVEGGVTEEFMEPYCELARAGRRSKPDSAATEAQDTGAKVATNIPFLESGKKRERSSLSGGGGSGGDVGAGPASCGKKSKPASISPGLYWSEQYADLMAKSGSGNPETNTVSLPDPIVATESALASKKTVANPEGRKIVLLSTALDPSLQTRLQDLADSCDRVSVVNNFSEEVTHLVVSVDKRRVMQQRTMKYMQALICKSIEFDSHFLSCVAYTTRIELLSLIHLTNQAGPGWLRSIG